MTKVNQLSNSKLLSRGSWPLNIPFGFGGAAISGEGGGYGFGKIANGDAQALLEAAFDRGVKLYDSAPIYGFGLSEQRLGKTFKANREQVFIISKCGVTWHKNKRVNMTNSPEVAILQLEQSLRDLNSDYVDLYMVHWPDENVDIRKTVEVLARAKDKGMIKHIGLCNTNVCEIKLAEEVCRVEAVQSQLNLFERAVEDELFPYIEEKEISFMSWGTLDKGILSGRVTPTRTFDSSDCRSWAPWWKKSDHSFKYEALKKINPLLKEYGHTLVEMALGQNLDYPQVDCVLCGPKDIKQLEELLESIGHLPGDKVLNQVREVADESRRHHSNS